RRSVAFRRRRVLTAPGHRGRRRQCAWTQCTTSFCSRPRTPIRLRRSSMVGNLAAWLIDAGLAHGAGPRIALGEGTRAWTFDELANKVGRTSSALRGLRLQRGERVLILMRDTLEAAAAILGTIHAGAIAVPVSELATADDVQDYVLHAG